MTDTENSLAFEVSKADHTQTRIVSDSIPDDLASGQVLLKIDRFAFTSNNITYAMVGEAIGYWKFFPADDGWGRIPASAFADVVRSNHPDVQAGERVLGWFPMAHHLLIDAGAVNAYMIVDQAPHRTDTAPVYRSYTRTAKDAQYDAAFEDQHLLLYILFMTGFLVDDMIADNDFFDAEASSHRSRCLPILRQQRRPDRRTRLGRAPLRIRLPELWRSLPADASAADDDANAFGQACCEARSSQQQNREN